MLKLHASAPLGIAVVDSNTFVSAMLLPRSIPGQALDVILQRRRIAFSLETFTELHEVLNRRKFDKYVDASDRKHFFNKVIRYAVWVQVAEDVVACRDPKDDKFLSVAVAAGASIIVTGDDDLLTLHPFRGINILNPRDFLATA